MNHKFGNLSAQQQTGGLAICRLHNGSGYAADKLDRINSGCAHVYLDVSKGHADA